MNRLDVSLLCFLLRTSSRLARDIKSSLRLPMKGGGGTEEAAVMQTLQKLLLIVSSA